MWAILIASFCCRHLLRLVNKIVDISVVDLDPSNTRGITNFSPNDLESLAGTGCRILANKTVHLSSSDTVIFRYRLSGPNCKDFGAAQEEMPSIRTTSGRKLLLKRLEISMIVQTLPLMSLAPHMISLRSSLSQSESKYSLCLSCLLLSAGCLFTSS